MRSATMSSIRASKSGERDLEGAYAIATSILKCQTASAALMFMMVMVLQRPRSGTQSQLDKSMELALDGQLRATEGALALVKCVRSGTQLRARLLTSLARKALKLQKRANDLAGRALAAQTKRGAHVCTT